MSIFKGNNAGVSDVRVGANIGPLLLGRDLGAEKNSSKDNDGHTKAARQGESSS